MKHSLTGAVAALIFATCLAGCQPAQQSTTAPEAVAPGSEMAAQAPASAQPTATETPATQSIATQSPAAQAPVAQAPAAQPPINPAPAAQPEMVRQQATVGVGRRGGDVPAQPTAVDIITTPTNIYFRAQEQVVFNIQIPEAMKLYKASEGRAPATEKEFFDSIIKANNIKLPDLPAGHKYVYDAQNEQLMVEHPN